MQSVTLACPKCSSTGTHKLTTANGASVVTCRSCHKNFRIEVRGGAVYRTQ